MTTCLRDRDGACLPVAGDRWAHPADTLERSLLTSLEGPVLDVGCGPGRHVVALTEAGIPSLGIDVADAALHHARAQGALVLERSVFERIPGAGRWSAALLLDGNVGIGGDPLALVQRVAGFLRPGGRLLVEAGPPGSGSPTPRTVRLEVGGEPGPWFAWVDVGADDLTPLAAGAGLRVVDLRSSASRWFGVLEEAR